MTSVSNTQDSFVIVTRPCMNCNEASKVEVSAEEHAAMNSGAMIQDALPARDDAFRELVISGTHSACWDAMFGDEDDYE
jgi:hypothetical protein